MLDQRGSRVIPGWIQAVDNFKVYRCPNCKYDWATKGNTVKCDHCNRTYKLDESNRAKVVMGE